MTRGVRRSKTRLMLERTELVRRLSVAARLAAFVLFFHSSPLAADPAPERIIKRMMTAWENGLVDDTSYLGGTSADSLAYYLMAVSWAHEDLGQAKAKHLARRIYGRLLLRAARHSECIGWGLGQETDVFGDGSVNPADTVYVYTTSRVVIGLEAAEKEGLLRIGRPLLVKVACALKTLFAFRADPIKLRYSNHPNDEKYLVVNTIADFARALFYLGERLSDKTLTEMAKQACGALLKQLRPDGSAVYMIGGRENDAAHHAMIVAGLHVCTEKGVGDAAKLGVSTQLLVDGFLGADGSRIDENPFVSWAVGESLIALSMMCCKARPNCGSIDHLLRYVSLREKNGIVEDRNPRNHSWLAAGVAFALATERHSCRNTHANREKTK